MFVLQEGQMDVMTKIKCKQKVKGRVCVHVYPYARQNMQ